LGSPASVISKTPIQRFHSEHYALIHQTSYHAKFLWIVPSIAAASLAFAAAVAFAHPGHDGASLATGLLHPLGGVDHIIALIAVGLLAVCLGGGRCGWSR
jgi:hydrogenase/urease accessory protein HupE